jgi:hypothetical protein
MIPSGSKHRDSVDPSKPQRAVIPDDEDQLVDLNPPKLLQYAKTIPKEEEKRLES